MRHRRGRGEAEASRGRGKARQGVDEVEGGRGKARVLFASGFFGGMLVVSVCFCLVVGTGGGA